MLLPEYTLTIIVKGTKGEYELVILRPAYLSPVDIKHPTTEEFAWFYVSEDEDGLLHEGSPTGPPLPQFHSIGEADPIIPLNPILVNFAAMDRLRRRFHEDHVWGSTLGQRATNALQEVIKLHKAVLWNPEQSHQAEFTIEVPRSQLPPFYGMMDYCEAAQPSSPGQKAFYNYVLKK